MWTGHDEDDNGPIRPGRGHDVSTITISTITEYQIAQSGDLNHNAGMANPSVVVPVRQEWSGQDWLVPYIISFTTTGWWNHAAYTDVRMTSAITGEYMNNWRMRFLPQACIPVVDGHYDKIMLVCVNKTGENRPNDIFRIPGPQGNIDVHFGLVDDGFADHVYEWLGIDHAAVATVDMSNEMSAAWSHLIDTIAVEGVVTKAIATVAELTRTRWNGYLVKTGPVPGDHHGVGGMPLVLGQNAENNINGEPFPNITPMLDDWAQMNGPISTLTEWRSTRLCQIHKSVMYLGGGADHQDHLPHAAGWSEYSPEYTLSESYPVNRVLIARDIFRHCESTSKYRFRNTRALMVFISETATLIGSVSNWMFTYYGMSLATVNRLYSTDRNVPHQQHMLVAKATNSLVIPSYGQVWAPYREGQLLQRLREYMNIPQLRFSMWKGLTLPWWLVEAVSAKFGLVYKIAKKVDEVCIDDVDDNDAWRQGYAIDHNTMWATTAMLTADDRYVNNGRYLILAYTRHGYDLDTWMVWNTDLAFDSFVRAQCAPIGIPAHPSGQSEANLMTVPYLQDNSMRDTTGPIYFVSSSSPNNNHDRLACQHGIRYPDPIKDHLIRAGKAALPEIVVGNVPGAIRAAVLSAADPAISWTLNKMADVSGLELFRPSGPS